MKRLNSQFIDVDDFREMLKSVQTTTRREFLNTGQPARAKADGSWVTRMDQVNHEFLTEALPRLRPLPVFSEENYPDFDFRKGIDSYWLVDPLDGTKEFASGLSDFCILIALIQTGRPVFSTILAPALDSIYWAEMGQGAFCETACLPASPIVKVSNRLQTRGLLSIFHEEPGLQAAYRANGIESFVRKGSALKFISLLNDEADIYYRPHGPHEWDIAAGDLLLREAGGELVAWPSGTPLTYNCEGTRVPEFLASAPGLTPTFRFNKSESV